MADSPVVAVKLTSDAADALDQIKISKGYSETTAINRAIQLSALVERKRSEGFVLAFVTEDQRGNVVDIEAVRIDDGS